MPLILSIPNWASFHKIPVGTPPEGLAAINAALGTTLAVGDINPVWPDLQDIALGGGSFIRPGPLAAIANSSPIENTSFLKPQQAQLAVAVGGEVTGMEVYFELDNLDAEVPATFPNRTYIVPPEPVPEPEPVPPELDEEGNPIEPEPTPEPEPVEPVVGVHTWATWGRDGESHAPVQIGDKWYKSSADARNLGQPIPASAWAFSGLITKTTAEYLAIATQNQPEV